MEGVEEEYSFCHILNLWFKILSGVSSLLHSWLGGLLPAAWVVMSYQSKALGMGKADRGGAASHRYLPGDSSIPLGSLTRRVFFY